MGLPAPGRPSDGRFLPRHRCRGEETLTGADSAAAVTRPASAVRMSANVTVSTFAGVRAQRGLSVSRYMRCADDLPVHDREGRDGLPRALPRFGA